MFFQRFYDDNLAQASYLLGCERTREAVVIDPTLDTAQYVRAAGARRLRIAHVTETHIHADFLSGARALTTATGATLHLSAAGDSEFGYAERALETAEALSDSAQISAGDVKLVARHTPGHTPEHMTFLVADLARGEEPLGALTGDFVFVGDVGRPDLLEKAAGARGSMQRSASDLYRSLKQFATLPDHLQIWPGHGAGSACGKSLGSMPQSTLGYEKLFNWAFADMPESEFTARVLEDQPVPPRYFGAMKRLNRDVEIPTEECELRVLEPEEFETALSRGAIGVDARAVERFAKAHIPGSLNIPFNKSFLNWCGSLVEFGNSVVLVVDTASDDVCRSILSQLRKIGYANVLGVADSTVVRAWKSKHGSVVSIPQLDSKQLHSRLEQQGTQVIDVRGADEWRAGHLPDALHIPLSALPNRVGELNPATPFVLHCKSGDRSAIAASFLRAQGFKEVANLAGGYDGWIASGFPVIKDSA